MRLGWCGWHDQRLRRVGEAAPRAFHDLEYVQQEFLVQIAELAPDPKEKSLPRGALPRRKEIVTTRISTGDTFRQEQYVDGAWAGEVLQALLQGDLGPTV